LASGAPAPGGGSTAALEGALGCALICMVTALTLGRKKYAEHEQFIEKCAARSEELRQLLLDIIDRDAEAFDGVSAVFTMPKETDEQKSNRAKAMQEALKACTLPPLEVMQSALSALELIEKMPGKFNTNATSDLGVAAQTLKAAIQGAWLNVKINLESIKDEDFVSKHKSKGEEILKKAITTSNKIHNNQTTIT